MEECPPPHLFPTIYVAAFVKTAIPCHTAELSLQSTVQHIFSKPILIFSALVHYFLHFEKIAPGNLYILTLWHIPDPMIISSKIHSSCAYWHTMPFFVHMVISANTWAGKGAEKATTAKETLERSYPVDLNTFLRPPEIQSKVNISANGVNRSKLLTMVVSPRNYFWKHLIAYWWVWLLFALSRI